MMKFGQNCLKIEYLKSSSVQVVIQFWVKIGFLKLTFLKQNLEIEPMCKNTPADAAIRR